MFSQDGLIFCKIVADGILRAEVPEQQMRELMKPLETHMLEDRMWFGLRHAARKYVYFALLVVAFVRLTGAADPTIYLIELFLKNQVLVHFDTEARRSYVLEYTDSSCFVTNGSASSMSCATWTTLYSAPALPFENHYIVVDYRTNSYRFYRLRVTP